MIVEEQAKAFESDFALSNVLVTVYPRPQLLFAVVEVEILETIEPDAAFKLREDFGITHLASNIIAGGKGVACIEAHSQAITEPGLMEDETDFLEARSQLGPLAGRVLDEDRHVGSV